MTALTGADIMAGADVTITGGDGASNQNYPSAIGLGTGAVGLYDYTGTTYTWGGLRYDGAYRVVYFSFGFEGISAAATRATVMDKVLSWLEGGAAPTATPTLVPTVTPTPGSTTSTGYKAPAANAAVTTSSGDNNGFQTNPSYAYASDNAYAVDTNSGTGTSSSYTSTAKDRHLFYTYGFGIPSGATILGIQVRLEAKADSTSGSPKMYVQLSGDGGATWTTGKGTATLARTDTVYTLGGTADLWSTTWTATQLSDANFRVRIINVATNTSRDFSLDQIAVQVTYQ